MSAVPLQAQVSALALVADRDDLPARLLKAGFALRIQECELLAQRLAAGLATLRALDEVAPEMQAVLRAQRRGGAVTIDWGATPDRRIAVIDPPDRGDAS